MRLTKEVVVKIPFVKKTIGNYLQKRIKAVVFEIEGFLKGSKTIIDVGTGSGYIAFELQKRGYNVTPIDVTNISFIPEIKPIIYDGRKLPFKDKSFDVCLLISVLHHTKNPEAVLEEAIRVSKKIVIDRIYIKINFKK